MSDSEFQPPNNPKPSSHRRSPWPMRIVFSLLALGIPTLFFLGYIGKFTSNFREITPGKAYRSAQMNAEKFGATLNDKKIKKVLNLRGPQRNSDWYTAELAACQAANVDLVDINIGLGVLPKPDAVQKLIENLLRGPYPLLLHCRAGSDRSGLASVFYVHLVEKKSLETALSEQLNWHYGHFDLGPASSIDAFFRLYHETANGQNLMAWCYQTYPEVYAKESKKRSAVSKD